MQSITVEKEVKLDLLMDQLQTILVPPLDRLDVTVFGGFPTNTDLEGLPTGEPFKVTVTVPDSVNEAVVLATINTHDKSEQSGNEIANAARASNRASGKGKWKALGLTDEEIDSLVGA